MGVACSGRGRKTERRAINMLVNMVFVLGLYVFVGNSGVISFGHVAFMAIGAYTAGLLTASPHGSRRAVDSRRARIHPGRPVSTNDPRRHPGRG